MSSPAQNSPYSNAFYDHQAPGSARSAAAVLPLVFELIRPSSMVDVGCGIGTWAKVASELGVPTVIGIDGEYARGAGLRIPEESFVAADLAHSVPALPSRCDLAISLEVAEHLPPERADGFVADLCRLADVVLFSAAIPSQLGTDHINLEPQSRWAQRFQSHGYEPFDLVRPRVWQDDDVEFFYRQNAIVYVRSERADLIIRARSLAAEAPISLDLVHPGQLAYWVRVATRPVSTGQAVRLTVKAVRRAVGRRLRRGA